MTTAKYIGICCIFTVFTQCLTAQTCEQYNELFPFLCCKKNEIAYKGRSRQTFALFYEKLLELQLHGSGQLNILHFGDSHIQADYMPNRMRHLLRGEHTAWSTGDRGIIFPFAVAKTDNPHSYKIDYSGEWSNVRCISPNIKTDLGLTGISITTSDPTASLNISQPANGYTTSTFTRVRIFHSIGPNTPKIRLGENDNVQHQITNEALGYTLFLLKKPTDSLALFFDFMKHNEQEISIYGISLESGHPGSIYSALGVNGATVKSVLKSNLFEKQLSATEPALIILSYGANDVYTNFNAAEFESNYTLLIRRIRKVFPNMPILLTTPGDALKLKKYPIAELPQLVEIINRVAELNHCAVWDFYTVMGGKGSIHEWHDAGLTNADKLHFIKKGYELQADLLFQALILRYLKHLK